MRHKLNRAGYTLVNMIVIIGLLSTVLTSVALSLHGMYRLEQSVQDDFDLLRNRSRLSNVLRQDSHTAISVEGPTNEKPSIKFVFADDTSVAYEIVDASIVRTKHKGGEVVHRDAFVLAEDFELRFTLDKTAEGNELISLKGRQTTTSVPTTNVVRSIEIVCAVGISQTPHNDDGVAE